MTYHSEGTIQTCSYVSQHTAQSTKIQYIADLPRVKNWMQVWVSEVVKDPTSTSPNDGLIIVFPENMTKPESLHHNVIRNSPG